MISISFDPDNLKDTKKEEWTRLERRLMRATAIAVNSFHNEGTLHENRKLIRDLKIWLLDNVFANKCAYCEKKFDSYTSATIDHYRPKKMITPRVEIYNVNSQLSNHPGYFWLTFNWKNLLPACSDCQHAKQSKFPTVETNLYVFPLNNNIYKKDEILTLNHDYYYPDPSELDTAEKPLFINPYNDNPENHLLFDVCGNVHGRDEKGKKTIEELKLYQHTSKRHEKAMHICNKILFIVSAEMNLHQDKKCVDIVHILKQNLPESESLEYSASTKVIVQNIFREYAKSVGQYLFMD